MIDIIAGLLELLVKWKTGNKKRYCWLIHLISGLLWTYIAFTTKLYGILIITIPGIYINIRNFVKWTKEDVKNTSSNT